VGLEALAEPGCAVKIRFLAARHSFLRNKCLVDQSRYSATMRAFDSRAPSNSDVAPTKPTFFSFPRFSPRVAVAICGAYAQLVQAALSPAREAVGGGNHYSRSIGWRALNDSRRRLRRSVHHKHRG
jgi:hypothetical protein